jgi:hypothetical protein
MDVGCWSLLNHDGYHERRTSASYGLLDLKLRYVALTCNYFGIMSKQQISAKVPMFTLDSLVTAVYM